MGEPVSKRPEAGEHMPVLRFPPISRTELALFAGASHDHTPIHIDIDYVRAAGGDDVIAHGMLVMGRMVQAVTRWRPGRRLVSSRARFLDVVNVGDALSITGVVTAADEGETCVELAVTTGDARRVMTGQVIVAE